MSELEKALIDIDIPSYKLEASHKIESFNIKGLPQLFYWAEQELIRYSGEKTFENIREWIQRRKSPKITYVVEEKTQLRTQAELCASFSLCMIGKGISAEILLSVSRRVDITIFSSSGGPELILFLNYGEIMVPYNATVSVKEIIEFISEISMPALIPLEKKYLAPLFNQGGTALVLLRDKKSRFLDWEISGIGNSLKGKAILLINDVTIPLGKQVQELLKVPDRLLPCIRLIVCKGGSLNITQYNMLDEFTTENILSFYKRWEKGLVSPFVLSQEIPKKNADNRVWNLVRQNFEKVVYEEGVNVFVMFFAPWCEYSKKTFPEIEKIAFEMREISNLVVGRIDCYNNDIDEGIKGFPTLRLYPAHNKTHLQYDGERTAALMKRFILSNIKPIYKLDL